MSLTYPQATQRRPETLLAAVALAVIGGVAAIATLPLIPDDAPDAVLWLSLAAGVLFIIAAAGVWQGIRAAAYALFALALLNGLAAAPGIPFDEEWYEKAFAAVGVTHAIALCWLLAAKNTREALR